MKQRIVLVGMCLSVLVSSSYAISLRDSVEKTLNTNPDIIAEKKNQEAYRKYVDDREGLYLPTLDIEAYLESAEVERDYDSGTDTKGSEDGYNAAIILRQYLYDGGSTPSQVSEAKHQNLANKYRSFYAIENTILEIMS